MNKRVVFATAAFLAGGLPPAQPVAQPQQPTIIHRRTPPPARVIEPAPATIPLPNPNTPLGLALAQKCSTGYPDGAGEPIELVVPGPKGDMKLDGCYRGRGQLSCEFDVLKQEATSLMDGYRHIVETNYPEIQDVSAMCTIQAANLSNDLQRAREFAERFTALKAEYDSRSACAARVVESLKQATLNDLSQAPNLLKSILDSMDAEMKQAGDTMAQVSAFAESMAVSQRAMGTLGKVHRAVCMMAAPKPPKTQ